jgi:dTDP-4-amino-4,6-dideoxygalactose transaminase
MDLADLVLASRRHDLSGFDATLFRRIHAMKYLIVALALLAFAVPCEARGHRQQVVVQQVVVQRQRVQRVRVQRVVVQQQHHHAQQVFVQPVYSQQFVQPYVQQFNGNCHSNDGTLQLNGGGCSAFLRY